MSLAEIDRTAVVEDPSRLGQRVRIGPYSIIGPEVVLGDDVVLGSQVVITGKTEIGAGTRIFPFAVIGGEPQDTSYRDEPSGVLIGPNCTIREHVTIHRGTARGRMRTVVGKNCFIMVGSHVAHDCVLGDNITMVNNATLGGHVVVGDYAILGGLSAVQQRLRIGAYSFVGGHSGIGGDLIPFGTAVGRGAHLNGLNIVGLKRRGFDRKTIYALRAAYRALFEDKGGMLHRLDEVAAHYADLPAVMMVVDFIRARGSAPLCLPNAKYDG